MRDEWALFRRHKIGPQDNIYLDRYTLLGTPYFSIKFHRIFRPDRQRDLHDHPWNFLSLIIKGCYTEITEDKRKSPDGCYDRVWFSFHKAEEFHRIDYVSKSPIWTLVFCGSKKRDWGFKITETGEWVQWEKYEKLYSA